MSEKKEKITGRICKVQRELFTVITDRGECTAQLKGSYHKTGLDFPVIGDYVKLLWNPYGNSVIEEIQERKSIFRRADLKGHAAPFVKTVNEQVLAANFDYVFIVASLNQNYNVNRIIRYISTTLQSGAKPVVVLTKADLCFDSEKFVEEIKKASDKADVYAVSAKTGKGLEDLKEYLKPGITIALMGSSGVGKSTLVNTIAGEEIMKVNEIRESDARGKHTTTHRELITLPSGVCVIDTPGIRELGMYDAEEGIQDTFSDITALFPRCKFSNCRHQTEPGCAVKLAIQNHEISQERWNLYCKLMKENSWGVKKSVLGGKR